MAPRRSSPRSRPPAARAVALQGDITDPTTPDALFGALEEAYGRPVLCLVNNAGVTDDDLTPSLSDEAWRR